MAVGGKGDGEAEVRDNAIVTLAPEKEGEGFWMRELGKHL